MSTVPNNPFLLRAQTYTQKASHMGEQWYSPEGIWRHSTLPPETREKFWLCCALYLQGKDPLANAIILQANIDNSHEYGCPTTYNIFHSNIALVLLKEFSEQMTPEVKTKLARLVKEGLEYFPGNRFADYQFHGYNDNFPAKATMGLVLGGEMFGNPEPLDHGLWNLRQFHEQLRRGGINSEFNSPTYSPLTIHAMAEIAQQSTSPEARELALAIEERLWIDMAARFHPEMGTLCGPHSRAYTIDSLAHLSCATSLLWFVLGDKVRINPLHLFNPPQNVVWHHNGDIPFNIAQMCWFAVGHYHIPQEAIQLFAKKNYPFRISANAEMGDWGPDFPARQSQVTTHMEKDYAIGTSSSPFGNGWQAAPYVATYKRKSGSRNFHDIGTVYSKFLINEQTPGGASHTPVSDEPGDLTSHGLGFVVQQDNTVLSVSSPHFSLGGENLSTEKSATSLSQIREVILFPNHGGEADEILVGDTPLQTWSGTAKHGEWIACRRGQLLIAIRPLAHSNITGIPIIELKKENMYDVLSISFYNGNAKTFSRAELRQMYGGFVIEHASVDEYASLTEYVQTLQSSEFSDYFWTTRKVRYYRKKSSQRPCLEIDLSWSPGANPPRYCQINGECMPTPILEIKGLNIPNLPVFKTPRKRISNYFPWQKLETSKFLRNFIKVLGSETSIGDR